MRFCSTSAAHITDFGPLFMIVDCETSSFRVSSTRRSIDQATKKNIINPHKYICTWKPNHNRCIRTFPLKMEFMIRHIVVCYVTWNPSSFSACSKSIFYCNTYGYGYTNVLYMYQRWYRNFRFVRWLSSCVWESLCFESQKSWCEYSVGLTSIFCGDTMPNVPCWRRRPYIVKIRAKNDWLFIFMNENRRTAAASHFRMHKTAGKFHHHSSGGLLKPNKFMPCQSVRFIDMCPHNVNTNSKIVPKGMVWEDVQASSNLSKQTRK